MIHKHTLTSSGHLDAWTGSEVCVLGNKMPSDHIQCPLLSKMSVTFRVIRDVIYILTLNSCMTIFLLIVPSAV